MPPSNIAIYLPFKIDAGKRVGLNEAEIFMSRKCNECTEVKTAEIGTEAEITVSEIKAKKLEIFTQT